MPTATSGTETMNSLKTKTLDLFRHLERNVFTGRCLTRHTSNQKKKTNSDLIITDKEPTQGWLVDDFADIYRDLKIELTKIEKIGTDEAVEDALWQLKWSFTNHWGQHCINALRALHYLWYDGKQT
jgi:hypothetical protein